MIYTDDKQMAYCEIGDDNSITAAKPDELTRNSTSMYMYFSSKKLLCCT